MLKLVLIGIDINVLIKELLYSLILKFNILIMFLLCDLLIE